MQSLNEIKQKNQARQAEITTYLTEVDKVIESAYAEISELATSLANLKSGVADLSKTKDELSSDIEQLRLAKTEDEDTYSKAIKDQEDKLERLKLLNTKAQEEYAETIKSNNKEKDEIVLGRKDLEDREKSLSIKQEAVKQSQLQLLEDRRRFEAEKSPFSANI